MTGLDCYGVLNLRCRAHWCKHTARYKKGNTRSFKEGTSALNLLSVYHSGVYCKMLLIPCLDMCIQIESLLVGGVNINSRFTSVSGPNELPALEPHTPGAASHVSYTSELVDKIKIQNSAIEDWSGLSFVCWCVREDAGVR